MILIEGKKYSCDSCIKGHRSSACKHTERPLFEIQKKGRPITQCHHCRELRKTKQVHVKCHCGEAKINSEDIGASKSSKQVHEAAFPSGLSKSFSASVSLLPEHSSDSDQPSSSTLTSCRCDKGEECHCAVPRKVKRIRQKPSSSNIINPVSTKLLAPRPDLTHYRPVLPKPSQTQFNHNLQGPVHVPSAPAIGHTRHYNNSNSLYSPYEKAYSTARSDHSYEDDVGTDIRDMQNILVTNPDGQPILWNDLNATDGTTPSLCGCGDSCTCPCCFEHRGPVAAVQALLATPADNNGCTNPSKCTSCVSVVLGQPFQNPQDTQDVEEWLWQLTVPSPLASDDNQASASAIQQHMEAMTAASEPVFDVPPIDVDSCSNWIYDQFSQASECCSGSCKCPPGLCGCTSGCNGICHGYGLEEIQYE